MWLQGTRYIMCRSVITGSLYQRCMKNDLTNESAKVMDKYEKSLKWRLTGKNNKAYPRLSGIPEPLLQEYCYCCYCCCCHNWCGFYVLRSSVDIVAASYRWCRPSRAAAQQQRQTESKLISCCLDSGLSANTSWIIFDLRVGWRSAPVVDVIPHTGSLSTTFQIQL